MRIVFRDILAGDPPGRPYRTKGDSVYGRAAVSVYATRWLALSCYKLLITICTTFLEFLLYKGCVSYARKWR